MEEIRPNNERDELIAKIVKKNLRLSYSTLKNFTSPINLVNYKLKGKTSNPSMIFGSLCDCIILTPDEVEKKFMVLDKVPTSDNQVSLANALIAISKKQELTESVIKEEFKNHYKVGDALKTWEILKDYVLAKSTGLEIVDQKTMEEAKTICENLVTRPEIEEILTQVEDVQKQLKWFENGWEFVGFMDILTKDHIYDLKFSKDANPEKFERDIANFDYYLQGAMYCLAAHKLKICDLPRYSFIVYDKSMNYSIIELDYSYLRYGERKYLFLLQELDRLISECAFDESYNFFQKRFTAFKPKWVKGFTLDNDKDEI